MNAKIVLGLTLVCLLQLQVLGAANAAAKQKVNAISAQACAGHEPNAFKNVKLNNGLLLSGLLDVTSPWTNVTVNGRMGKCKVDEDIRKCYDKASVIDYPGFCAHVRDKEDHAWSEITRHTENFPAQCPITPNKYKIVDAPITLHSLLSKGLSIDTFKFALTFFSQGTEVACVEAIFHVEV